MSVTGALILGFFATVWWVVGLRAAAHGAALVYAVPLVVAAALIGVAWHLAQRGTTKVEDEAEEARRDRLVGWASAGEGIAIFIAANVLVNLGHRDAVAPAVAIIVGAHFLPLARGLPAPAYYVTAGVLVLLGLAGLGIADPSLRLTIVSAGAAAILWLTAFSALRRASEPSAVELRRAP
jgi:hypothetical protein